MLRLDPERKDEIILRQAEEITSHKHPESKQFWQLLLEKCGCLFDNFKTSLCIIPQISV
ncbi:MAG: hypothetical protein K9I80_06765 [Ignavibacteriales bacterium]|nr:hypothetical protein [Ignavibacteriales bacterium]